MNNFLKIVEKKISENVSCEKILLIDNSHKHVIIMQCSFHFNLLAHLISLSFSTFSIFAMYRPIPALQHS